MLVEAVQMLLAELNQYIRQADGDPLGTSDAAVWGNIAQVDHPDVSTDLENRIVLTLVNAEEEATLKNGPTATREASGSVTYRNRPVHLNLYLLFAASHRNYETALKRLAQVMTFFQGKQTFNLQNSPRAARSGLLELSLTLNLLSLSFEEVNHLWGSLGGKQLPFVIYRGRLVTIRDLRVLEGGGQIVEIDVVGRDATR